MDFAGIYLKILRKFSFFSFFNLKLKPILHIGEFYSPKTRELNN